MGTTTIELAVDEETARAYSSLSEEVKERISASVSEWVRRSVPEDGRSLAEMARGIGDEAQRNGMTEDVLAEILPG